MLFFVLGIISFVIGLVIFASYGWEIAGPDFFFFIFGGIFSVCGILWIVGSKAENKRPLLSVRARVLAKTTEASGGGTNYVGNGQFSHDSAITGHFVSFEFDGHRENFAVNLSVYNTLAEGDTGLLEYKDRHGTFDFINFTRQA